MGHPWESVLNGLRADALDCLQTTLALLADHAYGTGTHLALGVHWRFPARESSTVGHLQPSLPERLEQAKPLGLSTTPSRGPIDTRELRARLAADGTLCLVGDAYHLPWVPYAGHRHMPHSFLVELGASGYVVVDAYHNDTEWGAARPGAWTLDADGMDRAIMGGALAVTVEPGALGPAAPDPSAVLAANAERARTAGWDIDRYVATVRRRTDRPEAVERLVLDIWLLGRERLLHSVWLADHPAAARTAAHAQEWRHLAAQSYLAMRRARAGRQFSPTVVDELGRQLHADAELAAALAPPGGTATGAVARAVLDALQRTLRLDEQTIRRAGTLRALPGFDSFRLVDVIDQVEHRLGVHLPADLSGDQLRDVDGLCRLFADATTGRAGWSER